MPKVTQLNKETKLNCATCPNMREVVEQVNNLRLQKEDIVDIFKDGEQYYILYYK